jgi:predicted MFS family arabinose efflux permease
MPHPQGTETSVSILSVTTLALTATTWGTLLYAPAATLVTKDLGFSVTAIGYQVGLAYFSALASSLFAGSITVLISARWTMIIAIILAGTGSLVTTTFSLYGMVLGTILIGFGHGLVNPASAVLLSKTSGNRRRSFLFSVKQTGTPLGGMLTALITPLISETFNWNYAGYTLASICFLFAFMIWIISRNWSDDRPRKKTLSFNPFVSIALVLNSPSLRVLMIIAVCYSTMQLCLMTFLSPYFVDELGNTLVVSGILLATLHVSGGIGRPLFGWLSDRLNDNIFFLLILGIVTALCCLSILLFSTNTSFFILFLFCIILGGSSIGWNGLYMAEIVNLTEKENVSYATAGMTSFTFISATVGPFLFALIKESVGSFESTIAIFSIVAMIGSLATWKLSRKKPQI